MIIYDVLQHYYDNQRSLQSRSSLLMPPRAENNGVAASLKALNNLSKAQKTLILKDEKLTKCSVMSG